MLASSVVCWVSSRAASASRSVFYRIPISCVVFVLIGWALGTVGSFWMVPAVRAHARPIEALLYE